MDKCNANYAYFLATRQAPADEKRVLKLAKHLDQGQLKSRRRESIAWCYLRYSKPGRDLWERGVNVLEEAINSGDLSDIELETLAKRYRGALNENGTIEAHLENTLNLLEKKLGSSKSTSAPFPVPDGLGVRRVQVCEHAPGRSDFRHTVPAAYPIGRSAWGTYGHSQTARYTGSPAYRQADPLREPTFQAGDHATEAVDQRDSRPGLDQNRLIPGDKTRGRCKGPLLPGPNRRGPLVSFPVSFRDVRLGSSGHSRLCHRRSQTAMTHSEHGPTDLESVQVILAAHDWLASDRVTK